MCCHCVLCTLYTLRFISNTGPSLKLLEQAVQYTCRLDKTNRNMTLNKSGHSREILVCRGFNRAELELSWSWVGTELELSWNWVGTELKLNWTCVPWPCHVYHESTAPLYSFTEGFWLPLKAVCRQELELSSQNQFHTYYKILVYTLEFSTK